MSLMKTLLITTLVFAQICFALELSEFKTDNCTFFSEGPKDSPELWKHCCVEHDFRYWFGGDRIDRKIADLELKKCVKKAAGKTWATLMHLGISVGHLSPVKSKYHWGWGWNQNRSFKQLTSEEIEVIKDSVRKIKMDPLRLDRLLIKNDII